MAGEIRIIFMTGLLNPLVILESVRLLPGAQHSRPPRSQPATSPNPRRLVTAFPCGLYSVVKTMLFGNNRSPIRHLPCKGAGESSNKPPLPALLPGTGGDSGLRTLAEVTSAGRTGSRRSRPMLSQDQSQRVRIRRAALFQQHLGHTANRFFQAAQKRRSAGGLSASIEVLRQVRARHQLSRLSFLE